MFRHNVFFGVFLFHVPLSDTKVVLLVMNESTVSFTKTPVELELEEFTVYRSPFPFISFHYRCTKESDCNSCRLDKHQGDSLESCLFVICDLQSSEKSVTLPRDINCPYDGLLWDSSDAMPISLISTYDVDCRLALRVDSVSEFTSSIESFDKTNLLVCLMSNRVSENSNASLISSCSDKSLRKCKQLVVCFHPLSLDHTRVDPRVVQCMKKLKQTHVLVRVSIPPSDKRETVTLEGLVLPTAVECTFLRRDLVKFEIKATFPIPKNLNSQETRQTNHQIESLLGQWPFYKRSEQDLVRLTKDVYQFIGPIPQIKDSTSSRALLTKSDSPTVSASSIVVNPKIPRQLHLIWVGDKTIPGWAWQNMLTWRKLLPDSWNIRLWTQVDLTTQEFCPKLLAKLREAKVGAQRADILRYAIIHKYGGFYFDIDFVPFQSLEPLLLRFANETALCANERPMDWAYLTNAFFACIKENNLTKNALKIAMQAELNTEQINMSTGPCCLGHAAVKIGVKLIILPTEWFYRPEGSVGDPHTMIANHQWKKTWVNDPVLLSTNCT